jgi:hypothetical protein
MKKVPGCSNCIPLFAIGGWEGNERGVSQKTCQATNTVRFRRKGKSGWNIYFNLILVTDAPQHVLQGQQND